MTQQEAEDIVNNLITKQQEKITETQRQILDAQTPGNLLELLSALQSYRKLMFTYMEYIGDVRAAYGKNV